MLLGIISDLHANELALEASLAALQRLGVDRLVILGDVVGYGPDPEVVTQRIAALAGQGAICLMGNHDSAAVGARSAMNDMAAAAIAWTRPRLSEASRQFLAGLPMTATLEDMLFVHADASNPEAWNYVVDAAAAMQSLTAVRAQVTFVGHVHRPQVYCLTATAKVIAHTPVTNTAVPLSPQRQWLAVAGAVGQPRDGNPAASFMTYETAARELTFHRATYDYDTTARRIRDAGLPERLAERLVNGT
ncbi:metallophosphoesterase [Aestuariivirga litoralis]|uniref:Metallophosphoesterase n=1 Tax=Aestuariivirga litoralis TaxID=2650924 RepID=A0A2W2BLU6_9HYPH|nr:metallophosphoesterase family protein [Aestuariivirga litoralis]PZF77189.1 metallophosphoesterase [Aestuariivirga litoralis]